MLTRARDARLGRTPEAETPYRKAQELWDRRMGSWLAQARTWRLTAFAALGLAGLLGASTIALALRPAAVPFVIEASQTGEARLVGPANAAYQPNDAQISYHLARFIELVRGLPSDPVVVRPGALPEGFKRLHVFMAKHGIESHAVIGMTYDDPEITPMKKCRYDICVDLPDGFQFTRNGGVGFTELPANRYAVLAVEGDMARVIDAWNFLWDDWLPNSRWEPADAPWMEVYRTSPMNSGWDRLDMEGWIPVRPLRAIV